MLCSGQKDALSQLAEPVPLVIRNAPTKLMQELNYGKGYQYAHDTEEKLTNMQCLPDSLAGKNIICPPNRDWKQNSRLAWNKSKPGKPRTKQATKNNCRTQTLSPAVPLKEILQLTICRPRIRRLSLSKISHFHGLFNRIMRFVRYNSERLRRQLNAVRRAPPAAALFTPQQRCLRQGGAMRPKRRLRFPINYSLLVIP